MNIFSSILMINNSGGSSGEGGGSGEFLSGWNRRKQFHVTQSAEVETVIEFTVFNTAGTDTATEVYLDGNVRADWGDLRFTRIDGTTTLPFAILQKDGTSALVAVNLGTILSSHFYIYYDGPAASMFRIGHITDIHYDPAEPLVDKRDQSLVMTASFVERMETYLPHLVAGGGDWVGAETTETTARLAIMQDAVDELYIAASGPSTPEVMWVAPGNHDFDFSGFSGTRAVLEQTDWMETNTLYGAKEVGPYLIISLDANYATGTSLHMSNNHQGNGYINVEQRTWLTAALAAATKPVIVFCHQPLCEHDTDQFTLTKEVYHTENRVAVRDILEASNKVVCCIHGHVHYSRNDVINGIPYITSTNLGNAGQFGEQPATNTGKWTLIDLDSSSQTIRVRTEAVVSSVVETIYDQTIPFGVTQYFADISNNHEAVYALNNAAAFEKASFFRDPTQSQVLDDARLYKYPVNLNIPDPLLSDNTIKIVGRADSPNFGRDVYQFANQTGIFRARWDARITTTKTKFIKFGNSTVQTTPGVYIQFHNDGNLKALNASSATNLLAYATNTWYKMEAVINVATDTFDLYVDDVLEASGFAFNNNLANIDRVEIVTETGNLYMNNFRIMNDTDAEITAFQPEETP